MPHRKPLNTRQYRDLTGLERDNIARHQAERMARLNILKDYMPVAEQISEANLSEISDIIRSNTFLINTLQKLIVPNRIVNPMTLQLENEPDSKAVRNIGTFITTGNKLAFQFQKMADILSEYANNTDIKKINPKQWDTVLKRYDPMIDDAMELHDVAMNDELSAVDPNTAEANQMIMEIGYSAGSLNEVVNWIDNNLRSQTAQLPQPGREPSTSKDDKAGKKEGSGKGRFYPENVGVERKLL